MKLLASLLALGIVWLAVALWDAGTLGWTPWTLLYFVDLPQLFYVLFSALAVTSIVHSWGVLVAGVAMALGRVADDEREALVKGARALQFLGQTALWSGAVVSLIEVVISAHNAASMTGFLAALGVSALGVLYGLLLRIACGVGVQLIKVRLGPFVYYAE